MRPGARWPPPARLFSHSSNLLLRHSPCSAAGAAHAPRVMRGEQLSKPQIGLIRLSRQRRPLTAGRTSGCRAKRRSLPTKCPAASALALSVRQRQTRIRQIRDGLTARRAVCERPQFARRGRPELTLTGHCRSRPRTSHLGGFLTYHFSRRTTALAASRHSPNHTMGFVFKLLPGSSGGSDGSFLGPAGK